MATDSNSDFGDAFADADFLEELENKEQPSCNLDNPEECESCSG